MKLKKKPNKPKTINQTIYIYICTCMYNILLIYQIGVDVSTHPMVLSVPVQILIHTQDTHKHTHSCKLYRDAHERARTSERDREYDCVRSLNVQF